MSSVNDPAAAANEASRFGSWTTRIDALLERLGDRLNPILVKETRQAIKSRQFTIWFVLLLIACWIATFGGIALIGPSIYYVSAGEYLLYAYYAILALPLAVVIPFSAYRSLSLEQEDNTRDLLEVSALAPRQIINGKLGSAALQMTLYLSVLAPCIAFTYLLRGIDSVAIALLLAYAVLVCLGLSMLGLMLAAATRQRQGQVLLSVVLAGGLFWAFAALMGVATAVMTVGYREQSFWWANLGFLSFYATTFALIYQATLSLTTFVSANRSTGLRVALVVQQTVFLAWAIGLCLEGSFRPRMAVVPIVAAASVYWFLACSLMSGERSEVSHRVRRGLPESLLGRAFLSWFYPGAWSGYVFCIANLATVVITGLLGLWVLARQGVTITEEALAVCLLWAYLVAYQALGRFAIEQLARFAPISMLGCFLVHALLFLAGNAIPFACQTFFPRINVNAYLLLQVTSPFWTLPRLIENELSEIEQLEIACAVGAAAIVMLLFGLARAGGEARRQRVAPPKRVLEDDLDLSPPTETLPTNPWGDLPKSSEAIRPGER